MRSFIRMFAVILLILVTFTGCDLTGGVKTGDPDGSDDMIGDGGAIDSDSNSDESESESETEKKDVYYKIIYPDGCDRYISSLAVKLRDDINKNTDHKVVNESDREKAGEYEILIGNTNREESALSSGSVGNSGWWVSSFGDKIAINAKSRQGLLSAVEYFLENYEVEDNGMVSISEEKCKTEYVHDILFTKNITLRVGTYNIKHGDMVGLDMSVFANDIKALDLDVVGLQEVDVNTDRVGGRDTLKELAESAGYEHYYFCKAIDYQNGGYGTAILSRYPIKSFENIQLHTESGMEGRSVGHAVIEVGGVEIDYFNTHLSLDNAAVVKAQFEKLNELAKGKKTFIITADFNTSYFKSFEIIENSVRVNHGKYFTFPGNMSAIDDIVLSLGWGITDRGQQITGHSDHNLFWAELSYNGGMK